MPIPEVVIQRIRRNLTEFGYAGLTNETVRATADAIERGEPGSDIITKFVEDMLRKSGWIKDED